MLMVERVSLLFNWKKLMVGVIPHRISVIVAIDGFQRF